MDAQAVVAFLIKLVFAKSKAFALGAGKFPKDIAEFPEGLAARFPGRVRHRASESHLLVQCPSYFIFRRLEKR